MKNKTDTKPKIITIAKTMYRIFELTNEGHFREPTKDSYGDESYIFNHYNGYETIEEAQNALEDEDRDKTYSYGKEYVVLPVIKTTRIEKE